MNINEQIFRMELSQANRALKLETVVWVDPELHLYQ